MMWILLGALLSFSVMALEPYETLNNVKILRILGNNIILLNRGLEDGIVRNDHIKISNSDGFISRAICLKASTDLSYWKIYRIPNPEAFSLDNTYSIAGLSDREIPRPLSELRDEIQNIPDEESKKKKTETGPDPFVIKKDLPEKLTERDLIHAITPEKRKLFVEEVLDKDKLERDLKDYRFSVYASPFMKQSINEGESLRYGFRGGNIASKYRLLTQFEQQQTKLKDPVTKDSVSTRSTNGQAQFTIHELSPNVSSLSLVHFNSQSFSSFGTPKSHWQIGPLGFTWHLYESKSWEYLDVSYVPLYDMRTTDVVDENGKESTEKTTGLRHGFRMAMKTRINERVALENILWVRPFQELSSWELQGDDLNLVNDLKLIVSITEKLFVDYNFIYQKDKLWKTLNNLPETNIINSLNIRYDFDL